MGLLNIQNMQDDVVASANLWNERFGKIADVLNGNVEAVNLHANSVVESKIAPKSVTASKIGDRAVTPSKMANTWVGGSTGLDVRDSAWSARFNKTISLEEPAYIYVMWTSFANVNDDNVKPEVRITVNDTQIFALEGEYGGLELYRAGVNQDFPFVLSGISTTLFSGSINVKVEVKTSSGGWDLGRGFVRIDALSESTYLG